MRFKNLDTSINIVKRIGTGIYEEGYRNNLLRDSEGQTFCGLPVYHLFNSGCRYDVLHFDDLSRFFKQRSVQGNNQFSPNFGPLFVSTNFQNLFMLKSQTTQGGGDNYFRADRIDTFWDKISEKAAGSNGGRYNPYEYLCRVNRIGIISELDLYRSRLNFGNRNLSVADFLVNYFAPAFVRTEELSVQSVIHPKIPNTPIEINLKFETLVETKKETKMDKDVEITRKWIIGCVNSDGGIDTFAYDNNDKIIVYTDAGKCKEEMSRLVLRTGLPHVKLEVQERAEISTSIVWK